MSKNKVKKISENVIEFNGERYTKEDSKGWLDIPELKISVEIEVHDKDKSWDELSLSDREKELLTVEQCIWLANSKYAKTLKMDGSSDSDDFFIQQPFDFLEIFLRTKRTPSTESESPEYLSQYKSA